MLFRFIIRVLIPLFFSFLFACRLWLLDNFTAANGAFYYVKPNQGKSRNGDARNQKVPPNGLRLPTGSQIITALSGSVILAAGGTWHGAAPNFFARPRVGILIQYVPAYVRPGRRYPFGMLRHLVGSMDARARRLIQLFDVSDSTTEEAVVMTTRTGQQHAVAYRKQSPEEAYRGAMDIFDDAAVATQVYREALKRSLNSYDVCHAGIPPETEEGTQSKRRVFSPETGRGPKFSAFPNIAFGVGTKFASLSAKDAKERVRLALKNNVRHLDLAEMYGNQKALGELFDEIWGDGANPAQGMPKRGEVFITSKVWATNMAPEHIRKALQNTLRDLRLEYLDAWLIHWPAPLAHTSIQGPSRGQWWPYTSEGAIAYAGGYSICDTWREMEKDYARGFARNIGVSNCPESYLHMLVGCAERTKPFVNQVESHPFLPQHSLVAFCRSHGIAVQAYSPSASGDAELLEHPSITAAAKAHHRSAYDIVVQWQIQRGVAVVLSSRSMEHIKNIGKYTPFLLSDEEMRSISAISATVTKRKFAPAGFEFLFAK